MKVLVTGSLGCIGSEAVKFYLNEAWEVHGVDNDMRKHIYGEEGSVAKNKIDHPNYYHYGVDISKIEGIIEHEKPDVIVHAAAQTSNVYSLENPIIDFGINAYATLMLLEMVKKHVPEAVFVYLSVAEESGYSFMKLSKTTGELYTQCYCAMFGLNTGVFKCFNVTGPSDPLCKEMLEFKNYLIHASDLAQAIFHFSKKPKVGMMYNFTDRGGLTAFGLHYPEWKARYNDWAIREELKK